LPSADEGAAATVPEPEGNEPRFSAYKGVNVAVTAVFAFIMRQFWASSGAPAHPVNCHPAFARAVKHTLTPGM